MTRKQALNGIANLYNVDISRCCSVGEQYFLRKQNSTIDKIYITYYLLLGILYKNNSRLKDVIKIHSIGNTIYFDLKNMKNYELCNL